MPHISLLLISGILLALLSACAPMRYAPGHKSYDGPPAPTAAKTAPSSSGYVKRGKPYKISGKWYYPLASGEFYDETGVASWYGQKFHGRKTANGEIYNMYAMTAAHTTLPLPSTVLVTNLENGKQIKVRVNDRGPFVKKRLIDLSYSAAKALGYSEQGTARVRVQTLDSPADSKSAIMAQPTVAAEAMVSKHAAPGGFKNNLIKQAYIQIGAFNVKDSAESVAGSIKPNLQTDLPPLRVQLAVDVYRVRLGPFDLDEDALKALELIKQMGYAEAMVIHD